MIGKLVDNIANVDILDTHGHQLIAGLPRGHIKFIWLTRALNSGSSVFYVKDKATWRSLVWLVGWLATIYLYVLALS